MLQKLANRLRAMSLADPRCIKHTLNIRKEPVGVVCLPPTIGTERLTPGIAPSSHNLFSLDLSSRSLISLASYNTPPTPLHGRREASILDILDLFPLPPRDVLEASGSSIVKRDVIFDTESATAGEELEPEGCDRSSESIASIYSQMSQSTVAATPLPSGALDLQGGEVNSSESFTKNNSQILQSTPVSAVNKRSRTAKHSSESDASVFFDDAPPPHDGHYDHTERRDRRRRAIHPDRIDSSPFHILPINRPSSLVWFADRTLSPVQRGSETARDYPKDTEDESPTPSPQRKENRGRQICVAYSRLHTEPIYRAIADLRFSLEVDLIVASESVEDWDGSEFGGDGINGSGVKVGVRVSRDGIHWSDVLDLDAYSE